MILACVTADNSTTPNVTTTPAPTPSAPDGCANMGCFMNMGVSVLGLANQMFGSIVLCILLVVWSVVLGVSSCLCCRRRAPYSEQPKEP